MRGCYVLGIESDAARDGFVKASLSREGSEFPEAFGDGLVVCHDPQC